MLAAEHADNVALNKNDAKLRTFDGKVGLIEPGPQPDWPAFAREGGATTRYQVTDPDGTVRYVYAKQTDVASGPGPNRKLADEVLDPVTLQRMIDEGAFAFGDQAFGADTLGRTGEIANIGPGASGAWGTEAAASRRTPDGQRANSVEWIGVNPGLHHQLDKDAKAKLAGLYDQLTAAKASGDPAKIKAAREAMATFLFEEAARNGNLPRNREPGAAFDPAMQAENGGPIARRAVDGIQQITFEPQVEGGPNRVKITLDDLGPDGQPVVIWKDALILSIGQDAKGAGGPVPMLAHFKEQLVPIFGAPEADGFRPIVGVMSRDGSVRVLGAAATPEDVSKLLDNKSLSSKDADGNQQGATSTHQENLRAQARELSTDSKGVVQGFVLAQQTIVAANEALAATLLQSAREQREAAPSATPPTPTPKPADDPDAPDLN